MRRGDSLSLYLFLSLAVTAAFFAYLPYFLGYRFHQEVSDSAFEYAMVAELVSMSVTVPIMLEALLDLNLPHTITLPRFTHIISLLVPSAVMYFQSSSQALFLCSHIAKNILIRAALMSHMYHDVEYYSTFAKRVYSFGIILACGDLLLRGWFPYYPELPAIYTVSTILYLVWVAVFLSVVLYKVWEDVMTKRDNRSVSGLAQYAHYYSLLLLISLIARISMKLLFENPDPNSAINMGKLYFFIGNNTFIDAIISVLGAVIPAHIARKEKANAEVGTLYPLAYLTILQNLFSLKKRFVKYLSREVRSTLDTVYMGLDVATAMGSKIPEALDLVGVIEDIKKSCALVDRVLDDMLILDEIEENALTIYRQSVKAVDLVVKAMGPMQFMARRANIALNYQGQSYTDPSCTGIFIDVDENRIIQVIRNLVSNALKFTPDGGKVEVFTFLKHSVAEEARNDFGQTRSDVLRIEIHDTGPGIPPERQREMFKESMQNSVSMLASGGSGVGIWVSKTIISLHGGNVGVVSEYGKGCVFFIELDVLDGSVTPATSSDGMCSERYMELSSREDVREGQLWEPPGKSISIKDVELSRVVIASACRESTDLVNDVLRQCASVQRVDVTYNEKKTIDEVDESINLAEHIGVIFIHCELPGRKPHMIISRLRRLGFKGTSVLLSHENFPDTNERFTSCGGNVVLKKPYDVRDIEKVLIDLHIENIKLKPANCTGNDWKLNSPVVFSELSP